MKPFKDQPIARKVLVLGVVPTVVAIIVAIVASTLATYHQTRTNLVRDVDAESSLLADNLSAVLAFNDRKAANDTLGAYRA